MIVLSPEEMRRLDEQAVRDYGIPGQVLMEAAGTAAAAVARSLLGQRLGDAVVVIICGGGNNGGDGLVVARHLAGRARLMEVFLLVEPERLKGEAALNYRLVETLAVGAGGAAQHAVHADDASAAHVGASDAAGASTSVRVRLPRKEAGVDWEEFRRALDRCDLIVDGIFGTGFHGEPEGDTRTAIEALNACRKRRRGRGAPLVLALDIPSGVDGATGRAARGAGYGDVRARGGGREWLAVRADATVTFGSLKTGLVMQPGAGLAGAVYVADIGLPRMGGCAGPASPSSSAPQAPSALLSDAGLARSLLPPRPTDSNKGTFGRTLIVAGSAGMTGAAVLAGRAALRAGAGLVTLAVPDLAQATVAGLLPEALSIGLPGTADGRLGPNAWSSGLEGRFPEFDAMAAGPGLGDGEHVPAFIKELVKKAAELGKKLVLDADALNAISRCREAAAPMLRDVGAEKLVLTPHPGEMARLLGTDVKAVQGDRLRVAREASSFYGATVVLKGAGSIVAAPDGRIAFNPTGNSALAVGGTGDVLTGVIVALLGQGLEAWEAAVAGAFWHGFAGDLWAREHGSAGLLASEVADLLPEARMAAIAGEQPPFWRWHELSVAGAPAAPTPWTR